MPKLQFKSIPAELAPMDLLLEADPSTEQIQTYLSGSDIYTVLSDDKTVGVCVLKPRSETTLELMNIAVEPTQQGSGIGRQLLQYVISESRSKQAKELVLGTGTFGYQLAFYQREGFRVVGIDKDFFLDNYDEPVMENGIQHKDMLRLQLIL
ncbi:GNAT family N-acetyltransferase [Photobacterium sp. BZF1]|nr:GNAT family N-acetyltransferase [Photobacterium sp. BZF1]